MNCRDGVIRNCPTIFENDSYTCFQLISVDSSAACNNEGLNRLTLEKSLGHVQGVLNVYRCAWYFRLISTK